MVSGTMANPGDKAVVMCPTCGDVFVGVYREGEELVALGGPECHTCGGHEFETVDIGTAGAGA